MNIERHGATLAVCLSGVYTINRLETVDQLQARPVYFSRAAKMREELTRQLTLRRSIWLIVGSWIAATLFRIVDQILFPGIDMTFWSVSSILYLSGGALFAALLASAVMGLRAATLKVAAVVLNIDAIFAFILLVANVVTVTTPTGRAALATIIPLIALVASMAAILRVTSRLAPFGRRELGLSTFAIIYLLSPTMSSLDQPFARLSGRFAYSDPAQREVAAETPYIDPEELWTSQADLLDDRLSHLPVPNARLQNIYVVSAAPQGSQTLFGREAGEAARAISAFVGQPERGLVLSNAEKDISRLPLASRGNFARLLKDLGERIDAKRDLVVIYLTAHGGRDASLQTDLPDYTELRAIDATGLAEELAKAGIRRRVIIVSSCYSGSWIPALKSDDTIIMTAARADRTSFGCGDNRHLTYFGDAMLRQALPKATSLAQAFDRAKAQIGQWEARDGLTPSEPHFYVGRNMAKVWTMTRAGYRTAAR